MDNTLSLAHALEAAALALQAQAGCPVTFSRTHETVETGTYQVVVEYTEEAVGKRAVALAEALIRAALNDTDFDAKAAIAELHALDEDERVGPSTGSLLNAAIARGIPFRRLTAGSLVQLGWGSKARKFQAAEVDQTSSVAESIAQDKDLTKRLLHAAGVPVPMGRPRQGRGRCLGRCAGSGTARGGQTPGRQPGQRRDGQHHHPRAAGKGLRHLHGVRHRGHGRALLARS